MILTILRRNVHNKSNNLTIRVRWNKVQAGKKLLKHAGWNKSMQDGFSQQLMNCAAQLPYARHH
mgnify:CR=1 FL=1